MSIPQSAGGPIESRDDLVRYLEQGGKPPRAMAQSAPSTKKFVYDPRYPHAALLRGQAGHSRAPRRHAPFGWEPVDGGRSHHRSVARCGLDQPGARADSLSCPARRSDRCIRPARR